mmetsp:Transcript_22682/g.63762  ORF Transcript_22682/g.63762 Transcript_22682/m.63762 type:complete len:248 (-) Transcript_22682:122-865(-)|eukprot:CAMPEP_0119147172 /NCGR_PEP_ID=MMETSP1310-20130426/39969_1 /TAXON_ID=464262 /ORGANISM="Genus nov. species nov., Strain RCC2339" /LENGTH=247 /DNA_ID=CAMNT_0007139115 /DNA_START=187 /DNA_END=930 /DNA_ORIENTATION=+
MACNGLDDNCDGAIDDCGEDLFPPVIYTRPREHLGWFNNDGEMEAAVFAGTRCSDDCSAVTLQRTGFQDQCAESYMTLQCTDGCLQSSSKNVAVMFDDTAPTVECSAAFSDSLPAHLTTTLNGYYNSGLRYSVQDACETDDWPKVTVTLSAGDQGEYASSEVETFSEHRPIVALKTREGSHQILISPYVSHTHWSFGQASRLFHILVEARDQAGNVGTCTVRIENQGSVPDSNLRVVQVIENAPRSQ